MKPGRELDVNVAIHVMKEFNWSTGDYGAIPHYSTDIATAWKVVEKMNSPFVALEYRGGVCVYELWDCQIGGVACSADTMPMAICLAALEFVGRKMEDEIR